MLNAFLARLRKLVIVASETRYYPMLLRGVAPAVEHRRLIADLKIRTLIDVGANRGQFSAMLVAHRPDVDVFAFEPLPEPRRTFERLFRGNPRVSLYAFAAGAHDGAVVINISRRDDSSSILTITDEQEAAFPGTAKVDEERIQLRRLDSILDANALQRPILIKLDVQGYEIEALKGMPELLSHADYVYAELSFAELYKGQPLARDVIAWLRDAQYDLHCIYTLSFSEDGSPIQADALFRKFSQ